MTLGFDSEALDAVAEKAIARQIGARGLRAVMEDVMQQIMFEMPSDKTIEKVIITRKSVEEGAMPEVIRNPDHPREDLRIGTPKKTTVKPRRSVS